SYELLHVFTAFTTGFFPYGGVILDGAGTLYGATPYGGTFGRGTDQGSKDALECLRPQCLPRRTLCVSITVLVDVLGFTSSARRLRTRKLICTRRTERGTSLDARLRRCQLVADSL